VVGEKNILITVREYKHKYAYKVRRKRTNFFKLTDKDNVPFFLKCSARLRQFFPASLRQ